MVQAAPAKSRAIDAITGNSGLSLSPRPTK
jgi:hypothetical protein